MSEFRTYQDLAHGTEPLVGTTVRYRTENEGTLFREVPTVENRDHVRGSAIRMKHKLQSRSDQMVNWALSVGLLFYIFTLAVICMMFSELREGVSVWGWVKLFFTDFIIGAIPGFVLGAIIGGCIGHAKYKDSESQRDRLSSRIADLRIGGIARKMKEDVPPEEGE